MRFFHKQFCFGMETSLTAHDALRAGTSVGAQCLIVYQHPKSFAHTLTLPGIDQVFRGQTAIPLSRKKPLFQHIVAEYIHTELLDLVNLLITR